MRPAILFPLFAEIRTLAGVGPRLEKLIRQVAGPRLVDLIFDPPISVIDRSYRPRLIEAEAGRIVTAQVTVVEHLPGRDKRQPYRVRCADETAMLELVFFHAKADYLNEALPPGAARIVSGRLERFSGRLQMAHPDYILPPERARELPAHEPVYALTAGLSGKVMAKAVAGALTKLPDLPEWLEPHFHKARGWPGFADAVRALHNPKHEADLAPATPARARLAYDELLASQLALMLVRAKMRASRGRSLRGDGALRKKAVAALPFALTKAQETALAEIYADMESDKRMLRLIQGDVGSGKTVVAFLALLAGIEAGCQGALMAPTEILVRQHAAALEPVAAACGVRLAVLTGREKGTARDAILRELAAGRIDILIGTHALFTEDVAFRDLGLCVVDEQHRFGVHQRLALQAKGGADVLVMTATPIPRTLALTAYGDMDISRLHEKPPGRQKVETRLIAAERLSEVVEHLRQAVAKGARAYWVCPLVAESEKIDLAAAEERAEDLRRSLGACVGLAHGQMKPALRDRAMAQFKAGEISVLVATTVIEVGVDVPEAGIMVVEHAERFGLAQLHQLRGRIGRGREKAHCLLLYAPPLGETAKARLKTMRDTDDGFIIAEEDLRLRGPGELLGTRQSGVLEFRLADIAAHGELLAAARDDAKMILTKDSELKSPRGQALRVLLYLFGRDEAVKYLRAG